MTLRAALAAALLLCPHAAAFAPAADFPPPTPPPPPPTPPSPPPPPRTIIIIADPHQMPMYNLSIKTAPPCYCGSGSNDAECVLDPPASEWGRVGCNPPPQLVKAALDHAVLMEPEPLLVGVLGDLVQHAAPDFDFTMDVFTSLSETISTLFPSTCCKCMLPLGNNDVTPSYYVDTTDPDFYAAQAAVARDVCGASEAEAALFSAKGYYSVRPLPKLRWLFLNTNLYHTHNDPSRSEAWGPYKYPPVEGEDPLGQFAWLEAELAGAAASDEEVYLMCHIAPTLNPFGATQFLWMQNYSAKFWQTVEPHLPRISGFFCGHYHHDMTVASSAAAGADLPLLLLGAVSPVYSNFPVVYALQLSEGSYRPAKVTAHYLPTDGTAPLAAPDDASSWSSYEYTVPTNAEWRAAAASWLSGTPEGEASFEVVFARKKSYLPGTEACTDATIAWQNCATCEGDCRVAFACFATDARSTSSYEACLAAGGPAPSPLDANIIPGG